MTQKKDLGFIARGGSKDSGPTEAYVFCEIIRKNKDQKHRKYYLCKECVAQVDAFQEMHQGLDRLLFQARVEGDRGCATV